MSDYRDRPFRMPDSYYDPPEDPFPDCECAEQGRECDCQERLDAALEDAAEARAEQAKEDR